MFLRVALGVVTLAVSALCNVANNKACGSKDPVQHIQTACKRENEDLLTAEGDSNSTEVCRLYPLVMKCSVKALPRCYDYIEQQYTMYGHSPFSCTLTAEDVRELQEIYHNGTQVKELPAPTTAATPAVVEEQSSTTFLNILSSTTFSSSQKVTAGGRTPVHPGNKERREGVDLHDDGRAITSNIPTMALLLVTTPLLSWLTS